MNQYKVTFKRIETFYHTILIKASSKDEAYDQADKLSNNGAIEFDYCMESDILDEHICDVEPFN